MPQAHKGRAHPSLILCAHSRRYKWLLPRRQCVRALTVVTEQGEPPACRRRLPLVRTAPRLVVPLWAFAA